MSDYFRRRLSVKLFLSYLAVILVGVVVLIAAVQFTAPSAFNRHMSGMRGFMGGGMGPGMMGGQWWEEEMMRGLYREFRGGFDEALKVAALAAVAAALVVSLLFSQRVVAPVRAMMRASRRIAEGHYNERVQTGGSMDELGQLALSFNQMAAQLEQVESMRRQLIGDVSHELRTPLTAIKGSVEGLMDGVLPATPETYQQIHQEADRLARLVDDLQELSRVEAMAYELRFRPLDVSSLIYTTVKRLGRQFEKKGISLESDLPAGLPQILADEDRIGQVLLNLAANALQFTASGGKVLIRAARQGDEVHISVADSGFGIAAEHLPHIFTRFYRVDKSRSRACGGSGIGLTIARHLVEAHGGRIWAESEGEGQGSRFTFTVKAAK